jgi:hypothetical protein
MTMFKSWWFRLYVAGYATFETFLNRNVKHPGVLTGHNIVNFIEGVAGALCLPGTLFCQHFGFTAAVQFNGDFQYDPLVMLASSLGFWLLLAAAFKVAHMIRARRGRSSGTQLVSGAGGWVRQQIYTIEED